MPTEIMLTTDMVWHGGAAWHKGRMHQLLEGCI